MGNYCCNYSDKDKNALNYGKKPEKPDPAMAELYKHAEKNEDKIVKI